MKSLVTIAAAPLLLLAAMAAPPAHAQDGHAHHAPAAAHEMPVQRYDTDAPLRAGMEKIRTAVDALGHYERGHMAADQALTFATEVQEQLAYLIANCKLAHEADAALHGIIAQLSTGAQAIRTDPADLAAIAPMRDALQDYAHRFNDPGWVGADEPEETR